MQVSLVTLRLELADECGIPVKFTPFAAPEYRVQSERNHPTYAQVLHSTTDAPTFSKDQLDEQRGWRLFSDLILETYTLEEIEALIMEQTRQEEQAQQQQQPEERPETSKAESMASHGPRWAGGASPDTSDEEGPAPSRAGSDPPSLRSSLGKSNTIPFFSGNPSVELTKGILHIYKDNKLTPLGEGVNRSPMICMLAVPCKYTIHDLIKFVAPVSKYIENMRIVRDKMPNQFMVLLKFKEQQFADEFYKAYNSTPYNTIEPDICHLVYVAQVEFMKESEGASMPIPGLTEMPQCSVCLERMEESVDGILTVQCNHSFHLNCLEPWGDTSCPVCRYSQTPDDVSDNKCMKCDNRDSLWICLICGHVGCGRYVGLHAYQHFEETNHTYAMQLGTNRVWDYTGENYVHRLVQNRSDGKLVQVDERGNAVQNDKIDALTLEYTYMLTTQLESQRQYFEEQMAKAAEESEAQLTEVKDRLKAAVKNNEKLEEELKEAKRENAALEKKTKHLHTRLTKALHDLQEEQEMAKSLRENQAGWHQRVSELENTVKRLSEEKNREVADLREQLKDLMFHLEGREKLAEQSGVSQEELQEGHLVLGAAAPSRRGRKNRR